MDGAITFLIIAFDPWNTAKPLTWLPGSTYCRTSCGCSGPSAAGG